MAQIYRPEHPRPDFMRPEWLNLNGEWQFGFDEADEGLTAGWHQSGNELPLKINVPFCYQSELSGIHDLRICDVIWYKRAFNVPAEMIGKRVLLRFGAVDYRADVYVNGAHAGNHVGGYVPFALDITDYLVGDGENELCVRVEDAPDCTQPRGKQYWKQGWMGCWYTPVSGIWQTVYLEAAGATRFNKTHITPDIDNSLANFKLTLNRIPERRLKAEIIVSYKGELVRELSYSVHQRMTEVSVSLAQSGLDEIHEWWPDNPNLYDCTIKLVDGAEVLDEVNTYFGMRKVEVKDGWVLLNNQPLYQRLILDQGYWPESLITPPSDEAIVADINWTKAFGYNGARKHQKIEDPRYYYWADVLGLIVWGEVPSAYEFTDETVSNVSNTLAGFIERDYNHPSIITWVPLNESWGVRKIYAHERQRRLGKMLYHQAKALDGTRPVSTNDGWEQVDTDIIGLHDYAARGDVMAKHFESRAFTMLHSNDMRMSSAEGFMETGKEAFLVTEYGGIAFQDDDDVNTWGYHDKVRGEEAFFERYKDVTDAVRNIEYCQGYCYTQLTDVQQETNGLLTPDRKPKIDVERFRALTLNQLGR